MEPNVNSVFHKTYSKYLHELHTIDLELKADVLGGEWYKNQLKIPFFSTPYFISPDGVFNTNGERALFAVSIVLCKYILMCPRTVPHQDKEWKTFRDFRDAGPLIHYFTSNTNKSLETQFDNDLETLKERAGKLGGVTENFEGYDISLKIPALPRVPLVLNFNSSDSMFPASCSILFNSHADHYLDMECLAITGTYLTGKLLSR